MVRKIVTMKNSSEVLAMFFNTLVEIIIELAQRYPGLPLVFSGGVFQNKILIEKIVQRCKETGRSAYFQNETAINDGGVSLGQAWFALHN